jgi:hypothetical protein
MDLLRTSVIDMTTLVAACHALKSSPTEGGETLQRKQRNRLRRDIKRGTVAYIDALARTKRGVFDDALLVRCRVAAEQHMRPALDHQALLGRLMASEAGSLDGLAAARHDLWRLAHLSVQLSAGTAVLRGSASPSDARSADALAGSLRRRVRKALIAYARAALNTKGPKGRAIIKARQAALVEIGARGAAEAQRLADVESGAEPEQTLLRHGVTRPLFDLALDWDA